MADSKISALTSKATPLTTDTIPIVDNDASPVTKKATLGSMPVSTAQQAALDLKANLSGAAFSGSVSATNLSGSNTGDQTISLAGDLSGSGTGTVTATIGTGAVTDTKGSLANKPACAVAATSNQTLSGFGAVDGVTPVDGTLILLTAQSTGSQNGPWVAHSGAWTRPTWYPAGGTTQAFQFITILIRLGTVYQGTTWRITSSGAVTIDTTSTTWAVVPFALNANTITGAVPIANGGTAGTTAAEARTNIGLGSVDNTSDANKPVSTATQTALDLKSSYKRTTFSNADASIGSADRFFVQTGTMSAARVATLPAASAVPAGTLIRVVDESGTVTITNTIAVARAGSDTINKGSASALIIQPYGMLAMESDGTSNWTIVDSIIRDVQVFTGNGTWTKRPGVSFVSRQLLAGGGGGGSGRKGLATTARVAGAGGGAGGYSSHMILASLCAATETIVIGGTAAGGAAQTTNSTDGNSGTTGNLTSFGTSGSASYLTALGGAGGAGGSSGVTATGGAGGGGISPGQAGGNGSSTGGNGNAGTSGMSGSGGAGGGLTAGDAQRNGAAGGASGAQNIAGGAGGASSGAAGSNGTNTSFSEPLMGGSGGGGGSASLVGAAGAGGNGGLGAGGGGGGASLDATGNSGAGGTGGAGAALIYSW